MSIDKPQKGLIVPLESLVDHYRGFVIATKQVEDGLWLAFGQTAGEERPDGCRSDGEYKGFRRLRAVVIPVGRSRCRTFDLSL